MLKKILLSGVALVPIGLARLGFNAVALEVYGEQVSGELNVALSLGMALALPVSAAFGPSVLRFVSFERGKGRPRVASWMLLRLLLWALAFEALVVLAALLGRERLPQADLLTDDLLFAAIAVGLSYSAYLVLRNGLYAVDRVGAYAALELATAGVFFGSLAALVLLAPASAALFAFFAGYTGFCLAALLALRRDLSNGRAPEEGAPTGEIVRFASIAAVATTASMGLREIATVLTPSLAGLEGTAFLALAIAALTPMHFLPRTLRSLLFAESATHAGRGDDAALARRFSEVSHQLAMFNTPIAAGVALLARPLLELAQVSVTDDRVLVFRLLVLAGLVDILASTAANALGGVGRVGVNAAGSIAGLAVAALVWLGLGQLGLTAVGLGYLAAALVRAGVPVLVAARDHGVRPTRSWPRFGLLLGAAGLGLALEPYAGPWIPSALYAGLSVVVLLPSLAMLKDRLQKRRGRG